QNNATAVRHPYAISLPVVARIDDFAVAAAVYTAQPELHAAWMAVFTVIKHETAIGTQARNDIAALLRPRDFDPFARLQIVPDHANLLDFLAGGQTDIGGIDQRASIRCKIPAAQEIIR